MDIGRQLNDKLATIVHENSNQKEHCATSSKFVAHLYQGCMRNFANTSLVFGRINQLLRDYGGWIVVRNGDFSKFHWTEISYRFRSIGITQPYLPISVTYDYYDKNKHILTINLPDTVAPKYVLLNGLDDTNIEKYRRNIIYVAKSMGAKDLTYTEKEATKIVELEIRLANITAPTFNRVKRTIGELQEKYSGICWRTYLTKMLAIPNLALQENDEVMLYSPHHLDKIVEVLQSTAPSTLVSYVEYRVIVALLRAVGLNICEGISNSAPSACLELTKLALPTALSALYVHRFLCSDTKHELTQLVHDIKGGLIEVLDATKGYEQSRAAFIRKIKAMHEHIAYPDALLDGNEVNKYYANVKFSEDYLQFYSNLLKFNIDESYKKLKEVPRRNDWKSRTSLLNVNAQYQPLENSIEILAGLVAHPIYNPDLPSYVNYAGMGSIVGHEIYHGVSGLGLMFDEHGQMNTWVTSEDVANLDRASKCIHQQHAELIKDEKKAWVTLDEDRADVVGVLSAYRAYQTWFQRNGGEPRPQDFGRYTINQLFWISYGRLWCSKESDYYVKNHLSFTKHSRYMYRVLVPLMNSEDFSKDFNCPPGSYMNPINKCRL
ncbi:hypothetical protein PPYR_11625 [Photinus pyralis]|uniref:Peptidase M13 C-terminal domain-containing protein n=3 Tax=Photinus pyralis TaxID=7054 RepID=A0A5N4ABU4_PHOPY|nr:hypothetical protein PPYR_11625 [Photinus pyralis]